MGQRADERGERLLPALLPAGSAASGSGTL